jgi:hypothetical protein
MSYHPGGHSKIKVLVDFVLAGRLCPQVAEGAILVSSSSFKGPHDLT